MLYTACVQGATAHWGSAHGFGLATVEPSAALIGLGACKMKQLLSMQNTHGHL